MSWSTTNSSFSTSPQSDRIDIPCWKELYFSPSLISSCPCSSVRQLTHKEENGRWSDFLSRVTPHFQIIRPSLHDAYINTLHRCSFGAGTAFGGAICKKSWDIQGALLAQFSIIQESFSGCGVPWHGCPHHPYQLEYIHKINRNFPHKSKVLEVFFFYTRL